MPNKFKYGERKNRKRKQRMKAYNPNKLLKPSNEETLHTDILEDLIEDHGDESLEDALHFDDSENDVHRENDTGRGNGDVHEVNELTGDTILKVDDDNRGNDEALDGNENIAPNPESEDNKGNDEALGAGCEVPNPEVGCEEYNGIKIDGRRIVELDFLFDQLKGFSYHNEGRCPFYNIVIQKEIRNGLQSKIVFKCNTCNKRFSALMNQGANTTGTMNLNETAVVASNLIGIGFSQLEQFASVLDIPVMCSGNFKKLNDKIGKFWEDTAEDCMRKAADEERKAAIERGDVDEHDGIPHITVITDECWSKRSYNKNYTALSGVGSIVGAHTNKVLWIGVLNKYCVICVRNENKNLEPPPHFCTRNYSGPSSDMEWHSILEGFQKSIELYNLRYLTMVGDGDSSTYSKIVEHKPYGDRRVGKTECSNHLKRNFRKQAEESVKGTPRGLNKHVCNNLERIRKDVCSSIQYRRKENIAETEKIALLKSDINNIVYHVFGEHTNCPDYIKQNCKEEHNYIPALTNCGTLEKLSKVMRKLMYCAKDLLANETNNPAEHYNSIVAKIVAAKRINFSLSWAYKFRANTAAVQFNTLTALSTFYNTKFKKNPSMLARKIELRRLQKCRRDRERRRLLKANKIYRKKFNSNNENGSGYGANHEDTDLSPEDFENEKAIIIEKLKENQTNRTSIEQQTIDKYKCDLWYQVGGKMLMASNFGCVCKARVLSKQVKKVTKSLMQTKSVINECESELVALQQLATQEGVTLQNCGIFIDETDMCLGASPNGIGVSDSTVVIIKCPLTIFNKDPNDPLIRGKLPYFDKKDKQVAELNKNHDIYYEIQGVLHICKKNICLFAIWTSTKHKMYVERITRDDEFFNMKMKTRLLSFYNDWLLPELADPRLTRRMGIREPNNE